MKNNKLLLGLLILIISIVLVLNRRIDDISSNKQVVAQSVADEVSTTTASIGSKASDFSVTTLDKKLFRLSDKKGKTVILFGMAGWCGTCIPEGRALTLIRKEYSDKVVEVIGVAFTKGDNEDFLKEFRELGTIDIPLALDTDNVAQKYNLNRLETTYVINKEGVIVFKDEQFTDYADYKRELDKII